MELTPLLSLYITPFLFHLEIIQAQGFNGPFPESILTALYYANGNFTSTGSILITLSTNKKAS